jgi:signal peptidase I
MRKFLYTVWEIAEVFLIAILAVAAIKYFLVQPFIVNGASMETTFYDSDYLLVDEVSYRFEAPQRGDVIVFHSPQDYSIYFIKRIIGLPGETVAIDGDKVKITNAQHPDGFYLTEPYLSPLMSTGWMGSKKLTLGPTQYFVMGDNRLNSLDSRYWGPLERSAVVGAVRLRLWPLNRLGIFSHITYAD